MRLAFTILLYSVAQLCVSQNIDQQFLEAIRIEQYKEAGQLLKKGADINALDNKNRGALEITLSRPASDRRDKFAKMLVKKRINVSPPTNGALHQSIVNNNLKIFNTLLKRGASPDFHRTWDPIRKNYRNETPLLYEAIKYGRTAMVKLLLDYGAEPNNQQNGFLLPVTQAILNGDINITKTLIDHGAILTKTDSITGLSAYGHAISSDNIEVFNLMKTRFKEHPFDANTLDSWEQNGLHILALTQNEGFYDYEIAKGLINVGINYNFQRKNGNTPLHDAVSRKKYKITKALLEFGADTTLLNNDSLSIHDLVNQTNDKRFLSLFNIPKNSISWKNAALREAVVYKDYNAIDSLVFLGARVSGDMLAIAIIENDPFMLEKLLTTGVDVNKINGQKYKYSTNKPVLEYAFKKRMTEVINIILQYGYDIQKILPLEHRYALKVSENFQRKNEKDFAPRKKENIENLSEEELKLYNSIYCDVVPDKFRCLVEIQFNCGEFECSEKLFNHTTFELIDSTGKTIYKNKLNKKDIKHIGDKAFYNFDINYFTEIPQIKDRGIHEITYNLSTNFVEKGTRYKIDNIQSGDFFIFNLLLIDQKFEVSNINAEEKSEYLDISFESYYKFYENEIQSPDYYYEVNLKTKNGGEIFDGEKKKIKLDRKYSWTNARVPPENLKLNYNIPYGANYFSLGETETIAEINFYARSWGLVKEYNLLDSYSFPLVINQKNKTAKNNEKFNKQDLNFDIFTYEAKKVPEYREYGREGILLNVEYVLRPEEGASVPKIEFYPVITDKTGRVVYRPTFINENITGVEIYETVVTDKINFAPNRLNILEIYIPIHKINLSSEETELKVSLNADVVDKYVTYEDIFSTNIKVEIPERYIYSVSIDSLTLQRSTISDANRSSIHKLPDTYWSLFADKQTVKRVERRQDIFKTHTGKTNFLGLDTTNLTLILYEEDLLWSDLLETVKLHNETGEFSLDTAVSDLKNIEYLKYGINKYLSPEYSFRVVPNQKENGVSGIKIYTAYKYSSGFYPIEIHPLFSGINNSYSLGFITEEKVGSNNRFYSYAYIGDTTYVGFYVKLPNHSDFFDKTDKQKIIAPENIQDVSYELEEVTQAQLGDVYGTYINLYYEMPGYYLDSKYDIKHHHTITIPGNDSPLHKGISPVRKSKAKDRLFVPYYKLKNLNQGVHSVNFNTKTFTHRNVKIGEQNFALDLEIPPLDTFNFYIKTIKLKKKDDEYLKQSYSWNIFINNDLIYTSKLVNADEKNQLHWPNDFKELHLHKNDIITIRLDYKSWDDTFPVTYWKVPIKKLKKKRGWYKLPRSKYTKKSYIKFN